jgi:ribosomal protein S18 acetylase RimI-like enzyme
MIIYRKAELSDLRDLAEFGKKTFRETFFEACAYTEEDLTVYFSTDYSDEKVRSWIDSPNNYAVIAVEADSQKIVGFMVIDGPTKLPHKDVTEKSGELKKLYIDEQWKGKGVAKTLMETGLGWLNDDTCPYEGDIFISVWSENFRAQKFYSRFGAEKVGEYLYPVGETNDKEEVWRISRDLIAALSKPV